MTPRQWAHTALTARPRWRRLRPPLTDGSFLCVSSLLLEHLAPPICILFSRPHPVDESFARRNIRASLFGSCAKADAAAYEEQRGRTHITIGHDHKLLQESKHLFDEIAKYG
jgi:hypothetical protein